MLIESIIQRPKGTKVTLSATYHFLPNAEGKHVAEVENEADIAALLAIKEGYRPANGSPVLIPSDTPVIDGPFFIIRGPQDIEAFGDWARSVPDMDSAPAEFVSLTDKIAFGEASLDGFPLLPRTASPACEIADEPRVPEHSPQAPAVNSIIPDQNQHFSPGGDPGGLQTAGDGGAGAAGGAGAETDQGALHGDDDAGESEQELDREALAKRYSEIHGHRPNGKWSAEKIAQVLSEQEQ